MVNVKRKEKLKILWDRKPVRAVFCAAGAGSAALGIVVLRIVATSILTAVTMTLASALFSSRSQLVSCLTFPLSKPREVACDTSRGKSELFERNELGMRDECQANGVRTTSGGILG